jgi:hypothetical protein
VSYKLLTGRFVIRYPDLPRQGPEPDGDTVKFAPDTPSLVEALPRRSGRAPDIGPRGISVRMEALDALETHFEETHQELVGANAARDELLRLLGFTNVVFFADLPNNIQSADQDSVRGHVLANGIDANGRMIGFVYAGDSADPDGADVFVDDDLVDLSTNAQLLRAGHAYPAFYATLPGSLRTHLAELSTAAREAQPPRGVWAGSVADPDGPATVPNLAALQTLVMWPKLFRRLVPYLSSGFVGFDGFDAWLRADPVDRDDELFLLDRLERGNMHDIVRASGDTIEMTVWPENVIISPDPAFVGPRRPLQPVAAGIVLIVAALPDPVGADSGIESVTLLNVSPNAVDLDNWAISDASGGRQRLRGALASGEAVRIGLDTVQLNNAGDTIRVQDASGHVVDQVAYTGNDVRPGRTICFGRQPG